MGVLLKNGEVPDPGAGLAGKLGTPAPGAVADVAVFTLERGSFDFEDSHGEHITGAQRFVPQLTLRAGEVWWRR
jgi:predicted amidohydrolase